MMKMHNSAASGRRVKRVENRLLVSGYEVSSTDTDMHTLLVGKFELSVEDPKKGFCLAYFDQFSTAIPSMHGKSE